MNTCFRERIKVLKGSLDHLNIKENISKIYLDGEGVAALESQPVAWGLAALGLQPQGLELRFLSRNPLPGSRGSWATTPRPLSWVLQLLSHNTLPQVLQLLGRKTQSCILHLVVLGPHSGPRGLAASSPSVPALEPHLGTRGQGSRVVSQDSLVCISNRNPHF